MIAPIYNKLDTNDIDMQYMFNLYLYYTIARNPKLTLHKQLLKEFKEREPLKLIHDIKNFSESYLFILNDKNRYIYCLRHLRHSLYWGTILTTAHHLGYEKIEELEKILVAYYYQSWIRGLTGNQFKQTSFNIIQRIKKNESIDSIRSEIRDNMERYETTKGFKEQLKGRDIYARRWDKALLLLLEYFSTDDSNQSFIEVKKLQTEHILSQNPSPENWDVSQEVVDKWTNSLANLTLLSMRKNMQASNESFNTKKGVYSNSDNVITSFEITRQVLEEEQWTEVELQKRQDKMLRKLYEILDIF